MSCGPDLKKIGIYTRIPNRWHIVLCNISQIVLDQIHNNHKICSRHDIAWLKINQSINHNKGKY